MSAAGTPVAHMGGMEEREDCKEGKVSEPGAARHGNFINYYEFHPPEERLKLLPEDFGSIKFLPVGPFQLFELKVN